MNVLFLIPIVIINYPLYMLCCIIFCIICLICFLWFNGYLKSDEEGDMIVDTYTSGLDNGMSTRQIKQLILAKKIMIKYYKAPKKFKVEDIIKEFKIQNLQAGDRYFMDLLEKGIEPKKAQEMLNEFTQTNKSYIDVNTNANIDENKIIEDLNPDEKLTTLLIFNKYGI